MQQFYLSKNYKEVLSAGNKAKTDMEHILSELGYTNAGLQQTRYRNAILGYLLTLFGILKLPFSLSKGGVLVIQYPFKKYYKLICRIAHFRGCKVVTLIHDLGSFRRKKLTPEEEIVKLSYSDCLIALNDKMKAWLIEHGYQHPIESLQIWDYLSDKRAKVEPRDVSEGYIVNYMGALSLRKNRFLYGIDEHIHAWHLNLYGNGFDAEQAANYQHITYRGFATPDELIGSVKGDFGLVWDGDSIDACEGMFGEYLQYNNPHKTSLYIRCHLPVIVWKRSALAPFVEEHQIGLSVGSLRELDTLLSQMPQEEYARLRANAVAVSDQMASGYYFGLALKKAIDRLQ